MCSSNVIPDAVPLLAELLRDVAAALEPEHPELVTIGPVDFGSEMTGGDSAEG